MYALDWTNLVVRLMLVTVACTLILGMATTPALGQPHHIVYHEADPGGGSFIISPDSTVVHSWPPTLASPVASPGYLRPDGLLLRGGSQFAQIQSPPGAWDTVQLIDWDGDLIWVYSRHSPTSTFHHDAISLPNGNVLLTTWESVGTAEAEAMGWQNTGDTAVLWLERLVEVKPNVNDGSSEVVWEWFVGDHLIQDADTTKPNFGVVADNPGRVDINFSPATLGVFPGNPFHFNGLAYNPHRDEILISVLGFGEIWIIDHSTTTAEAATSAGGNRGKGGDLLYRWGNAATYRYAGGVAEPAHLLRQHDARWLSTDFSNAGNITIHNNNDGDSQVLELAPPIDANGDYVRAAGETFGPSTPTVLYARNPAVNLFVNTFMGGAQKLPNGNLFITLSGALALMEVDENGNLLGYVELPGAGTTFKAQKYPTDYPGFARLNTPPAGPSPALSVRPNYPNPFNPSTTIAFTLPRSSRARLEVFDTRGARIRNFDLGVRAAGENTYQLQAEGLASGVYFYRVSANGASGTRKMIVVR